MTWTCTHSIKKCFRFVLSSLLSNHINCCMYETAAGLQLKDNIQKQSIYLPNFLCQHLIMVIFAVAQCLRTEVMDKIISSQWSLQPK